MFCLFQYVTNDGEAIAVIPSRNIEAIGRMVIIPVPEDGFEVLAPHASASAAATGVSADLEGPDEDFV
jgi:hypothetical protein